MGEGNKQALRVTWSTVGGKRCVVQTSPGTSGKAERLGGLLNFYHRQAA